MTTRPDEQDFGVLPLIATALAVVVSGVLWVGLILALRWMLALPVEVAACFGLLAGSALVFWSLVRLDATVSARPDRGRRPARGAAPPGAASASPSDTTPPQAGGRALRVVRPS